MKKLIVSPLLALVLATSTISFTGCQSTGQIVQQVLKSPEQFQIDVQAAGMIGKPYISAENQAKIHNFAVALGQASNLDLTGLLALLPSTTGSVKGDLVLMAVKTTLGLVYVQIGSNNPTTLAYMKAGSNGLLVNF